MGSFDDLLTSSENKTWDGIIDAISDHIVIRVGNGIVNDLLPAFYTGTLSIIKYHYNRCYMDFVTTIGDRYIATYCRDRGGFLGWKQVATAESPQVFNLPLVSGVTAAKKTYYYKTAFNVVTICGNLQKDDGFVGEEAVAILPVGFHPLTTHELPVVYSSNAATKHVGTAFITVDGYVIPLSVPAAPNNKTIYFNFTFIAA